MNLVSQRAYARHRGTTHRAVQKAIESGRIATHDGKIDPAEADRMWELNTDPGKPKGTATQRDADGVATPPAGAPPDGGGGKLRDGGLSYADARAVREAYAARLAKLDYEERSGKLVNADKVGEAWQQIVQASRTKVLALPSKIKTRIPKMTADDVAMIEQLVRECLEDLAEGGA